MEEGCVWTSMRSPLVGTLNWFAATCGHSSFSPLTTSGLQDSCRMRFSHQKRCSALINQLICTLIWLRRGIMSCNKSSSPVIKCKLLGQKKHYLQEEIWPSVKPPHGPLHSFYGTTLITVHFHLHLYPALLSTGRAHPVWGKIERTE